ncbi:putative protein phosphatase inhibitor [Trypanosoma rangeli]|uniref:Protein phosphatase inhibitor n=1 Tax=Trypanosoma rangeli TaxID=5698 RepID=A0A3R7K085_TRYRA|nr:putative protein phosphatase inhibitor [Trypanosoma rangeli]RNE99626.1 putative protein phosphatase inhibitor [Trypanosoma rangeli]|eukprot:RNE99626.1 putative protein phosphatase inhibitor [Trypanosoma rangeli]
MQPLSLTRQAQPPKTDERHTEEDFVPRRVAVLHLQPAPAEPRERQNRHVSWMRGIQEHTNQRVSKSCCIFHKKKLFGESSSDESTSESSSVTTDGDHPACGHSDDHHHRKRPSCTKDHCFCGTRFH